MPFLLLQLLDTLSDIVMAKEIIRYTNNSPDELDFLWLQMDQNLFMENSRGNAIIPLGLLNMNIEGKL